MKIARRVEALAPSATLAVSARARELKGQGVDVLSFAAGEPDFDTPKPILDAAKDALDRGLTHYGPVPGDPDSRAAVAHDLAARNHIEGLTPDHVVISSGGKHSLYNLFHALLDPPDEGQSPAEVLLPVPAWVSYAPQIQLAGGTVRELPTTAQSDFKITPDQLREAITPASRLLILNSPSNPCGTMYTPDELRAVARVVAQAADSTAPDLLIVSDELYDKITYAGIEHLSIGSLPEVAQRTITVNGLSKAYAMTGFRIGYFACPGDFGRALAKAVGKLQSQSTTSVPTFLMPTLRAAFERCEPDVEMMRDAFGQRANIAYDLLGAIPGFVCPRPTGAFYMFPDVSAHFGSTSKGGKRIDSAMDFAAALLDEHHVAVVPGEDFGSGGERCFRFTFACSEEQIRAGVERIGAFVGELSSG